MQSEELQKNLSDTDKFIIEAKLSHPTISLVPFENHEELFRQLIAKMYVLYGIRPENQNQDYEINVWLNYFRKHYSNFTFKEIQEAAELNLKGEFQKSTIAYHNYITLPFLTSLMSAYQQRKLKSFQEFNRISASIQAPQLAAVPLTPQEHYQKIVEFIEINGTMPFAWKDPDVFDYLWSTRSSPGTLVTETMEDMIKFKELIKIKNDAEVAKDVQEALVGVSDKSARQVIRDRIEVRLEDKFVDHRARKEFVTNKLKHLCQIK